MFGVWSPGEEVAKLAYFGLYALQHRGQESAGIAVSDGDRIVVYKDMGLVAQVFDEAALSTLRGHIAVGHCRYSTSGASVWENAQPTFRSTPVASLALGHNGNLINTLELAAIASGADAEQGGDGLPRHLRHRRADRAVRRPPDVQRGGERAGRAPAGPRGATRWSSWTSAPCTPPATRRASARWCSAGWPAAGWWPARPRRWTSWAPRFVREIEPGELIAIDERGVRSHRFARPHPAGCLFEYVYLARPDTAIAGRNVQATRVEVGRMLAAEHPVEADLVIPVPESGTPAAIGYAEASGIPYGQGLVKNSYVGRTFIQPSQTIRQRGIRLKLNPLRDVIAGQRLVVVDDSIVRGNTQRAIVGMLREAGAAEVHVRISSPPVGLALLLRDRLRDPGRADRGQPVRGGDPRLDRRGLARLHLAGRADRGDHAARRPALPGLLRRELPDPRRGGRPGQVPPGIAGGHVTSGPSYTSAGVDIAAGDRAVDLMRASIARTTGPEVIGGIGGFAGLFDASRLATMPAAGAGHLDRRRRHQGRPGRRAGPLRHRSGSTWSAWSWTTWSCAARSRCS